MFVDCRIAKNSPGLSKKIEYWLILKLIAIEKNEKVIFEKTHKKGRNMYFEGAI